MSAPGTAMELDDADLDALPLQVVLELGRLQMSLAELRRLAPGVMIPISANAEDALDVVVNGKRIGRAGLIQIGDVLGVRISRLTQDG